MTTETMTATTTTAPQQIRIWRRYSGCRNAGDHALLERPRYDSDVEYQGIYELPQGFTAGESVGGKLCVWDDAGQYTQPYWSGDYCKGDQLLIEDSKGRVHELRRADHA